MLWTSSQLAARRSGEPDPVGCNTIFAGGYVEAWSRAGRLSCHGSRRTDV